MGPLWYESVPTPGATGIAGQENTGSPATTFHVDNLPAGTYYFEVWGVNAFNAGPPSNVVTVTVLPCIAAPGPPALSGQVSQISGSGSFVTLSWGVGSSNPATDYIVEAGSSPGASDIKIIDNGLGGQLKTGH